MSIISLRALAGSKITSFILLLGLAFGNTAFPAFVYAQEVPGTLSSELTIPEAPGTEDVVAETEATTSEISPEVTNVEATEVAEATETPVTEIQDAAPAKVITQSPVITTDKADYEPGELVSIFGSYFDSLSSIVLRIFGNSEVGNHISDVTYNLTADELGSFSLQNTLDNFYRPFYNITASTPGGTELAATVFTDAAGASVNEYSQCANDGNGGVGPCTWTNGDLNANNSTYHEDDATVQRLAIDGLSNGTHVLVIQYQTTKGGKNAYDFLTTDTYSEGYVDQASLCSSPVSTNFPSCATANVVLSNPIPHDPSNTESSDTERAPQNFKIYNGESISVGTPALTNGTYNSDSLTNIEISFNVDTSKCKDSVTKAGKTTCPVLITWGAHISTQEDWGAGNSAVNISGSPYHVKVIELDGGSTGNRDNQMAASAVVLPNTVTIHKVMVGGTGTFNFTGTPSGTVSENNGTFSGNPAPGSYSVTEDATPGWSLTNISCSVTGGATQSVNLSTRTASYTLPTLGGGTVDCTFTNTLQQATLIVKKHVVNDNGGLAASGNWTMNVTGNNISQNNFAGSEDGVSITLNAGSFSVSESGGPAGYTQTSAIGCSGTISAGTTQTCTLTNDDQPGTLIVKKVLINDNGGTRAISSFNFQVNSNSPVAFEADGQNDITVNAGTYSVTEASSSEYETSYDNCSSLVISNGGTATCTITNNDKAPKLIVVKTVINDNGGEKTAADFSMSITGTAGNATIASASASGSTITLARAGSYEVTEGSATGYTQTGAIGCSGEIAIGEVKTCSITNNDNPPSLTLNKIVINNNIGTANESDWTLTAEGGSSGLLSGAGAAGNADVVSGPTFKAGTYSLSESAGPANYASSTWSCIKNGGDPVLGQSIALGLGDAATCTITNNDFGTWDVQKVVINDNGGTATTTDFAFVVNGDTDHPIPFNTINGVVKVPVPPDALVYVTEYNHPGYASDLSVGCGKSEEPVPVGIDSHADCMITNNDVPPILHLRKLIENTYGGTATIDNFTLKADGTDSNDFSGNSPVDSDSNLKADTFALGELSNVVGYSASSWVCTGTGNQTGSNITLGLGQEATCTITNTAQPAKLTIVKDAQINDLSDFNFSGTGSLGSFTLDDDQNVDGIGTNGDVNRDQSKSFSNLNSGNYTVTETEPNTYWTLKGAGCVITGTTDTYPSTVTGTSLTVNLAQGSDVTCTFLNEKKNPTRTQGFWQTHTAYTSSVFSSSPLNGSMTVGLTTHKGPFSTAGRLFGAFYSDISKQSNGKTQRTALDKAKMALLQQLVAAKLNCAAFGCTSAVTDMIGIADAAFAGSNIANVISSTSAIDTYNNSGDTQIINGTPGSATPKNSQAQADKAFWDTL